MKFKEREVEVASPSLLKFAGLDDKIQSAFVNAERLKTSIRGNSVEEFVQVVNDTNSELERRTKVVFEIEDVPKTLINLYSPFEGMRLLRFGKAVEVNNPNLGKVLDTLRDAFNFTISAGALGIEVTHEVSFGGSEMIVDYAGLLTKSTGGFEYLERERSWSGGFSILGAAMVLVEDVLIVRFKQLDTCNNEAKE